MDKVQVNVDRIDGSVSTCSQPRCSGPLTAGYRHTKSRLQYSRLCWIYITTIVMGTALTTPDVTGDDQADWSDFCGTIQGGFFYLFFFAAGGLFLNQVL